MAIIKPTQDELFQIAIGTLQNATGYIFQQGEMAYELLRGASAWAINNVDLTLYENRLTFWLDRLTGSELDYIGSLVKKTRLNGSQGTGNIFIQGIIGTNIPVQTVFSSLTNNYISTDQREIILDSSTILSVSRVGTLATVILSSEVNLPTGAIVTISGFTETNFNAINISINAIATNQFTYTVANTGSLTDINGLCSYTGTFVPIRSERFALDTDLINGAYLSSSLTIDSALVNFSGITGGSDIETDLSYRERIRDRINNNMPNDSRNRIIDFISENFPAITNGKLINNYSADPIRILSIEKIVGEPDNSVRKVITLEPHRYRNRGEEFNKITGSIYTSLNKDSAFENTFVGIVHDNYSFNIAVDSNTDIDNTSLMYLTKFDYQYCTIVLYKKNSLIKTLSINEINNIYNFLDQNIVFTLTSNNYKILSAEEENKSIEITLSPNLLSLQNAVRNNIVDYVKSVTNIGITIKKTQIENIIFNTIDSNGRAVENFTTNLLTDLIPTKLENIITVVPSDISFI